ncbi:MAG: hypothetical protein ABI400_12025 [Lacisediminihabitans sp.]
MMEHTSQRGARRIVGLLLFGLFATTACALIAIVFGISSASAAEGGDSAPPTPARSLLSQTLTQAHDAVVAPIGAAVSQTLHPVASEVQRAVLEVPTAVHAVAASVASPLRTAVAGVPAVVDAAVHSVVGSVVGLGASAVDIVTGAGTTVAGVAQPAVTLPLTVGHAEPLLTTIDTVVAVVSDAHRPLATTTRGIASDAVPANITSENAPATPLPSKDRPTAPLSTSAPGPSGQTGNEAMPVATLNPPWAASLATGRSSLSNDAVPTSPSFEFDTTPG